MNQYKLSGPEATALMVNLICNKFFLSMPRLFVETSGHSAFLTVIFIYLISASVWILFSRNYRGMDLSELCEKAFGKIFQKTVGALILSLLTLTAAIMLKEYVQNTKNLTLHSSPSAFITGIFGIAMIAGCMPGLKSIGKVHGFFVPIIFLTLSVLVLLAAPNLSVTNLFPLFGQGAQALFGNGFFLLSSLFELVVLFYLPDLLKEKTQFKRVGNTAMVISFLYFGLIVICYVLASPSTVDSNTYLPVFQIIRLIKVGQFFQRADSLFLLVFSLSGMLYLASMLYFICYIFKRTFSIPYEKPLFLPVGLLIISLSGISFLSPKGITLLKYLNLFLWIIPFLLPVTVQFFAQRRLRK